MRGGLRCVQRFLRRLFRFSMVCGVIGFEGVNELRRTFKVVRCPKCGNLQLTAAQKSYRCFKCGAVADLGRGNVVFSSASARAARAKLMELKEKGKPAFL